MPISSQSSESNQPITLAGRVYSQLRSAILDGDIQPGSKISEPELAKSYGVSRSSLREAIAKLEGSGLIERQANIGARVVSLSAERLLEIYYVRESMEGLAARLAADNMSEQEIRNLEMLLEQQNEIGTVKVAEDYRSNDFDFHNCIALGSHNERLIKILSKDLFELILFYRKKFNNSADPRPEQALIEHQEIVAAIARRDGEMAEMMMRHHIRAAREHAKKSFFSQISNIDIKGLT